MFIRNNRGVHYNDILANGVGGVSTIKCFGNSASVSEINNGVTFSGLIFGQLVLSNTTALVGSCLPQGGFNKASGISNCSLHVPTAYHNIGPSNPGAGSGLELPT